MKTCTAEKRGMQRSLEEELNRLKQATSLGQDLGVKWVLDSGTNLSGEVRGDVIYVHEESEAKALETLKREFIDHSISKELIEPLVEYVNLQKSLMESLIYKRKERLLHKLTKLVTQETMC